MTDNPTDEIPEINDQSISLGPTEEAFQELHASWRRVLKSFAEALGLHKMLNWMARLFPEEEDETTD